MASSQEVRAFSQALIITEIVIATPMRFASIIRPSATGKCEVVNSRTLLNVSCGYGPLRQSTPASKAAAAR
jgi:hypothetical protein